MVVWIPDASEVFAKGEVLRTETLENKVSRKPEEYAVVQLLRNGAEEVKVSAADVVPANPSSFDKVANMSELTHLNEPSLLHNLELRYKESMIYTYSGLFLVAINPYKDLQLYSDEKIHFYHSVGQGQLRQPDTPPHVFVVAEEAYRNLVQNKSDQSILVTGESGAGKTENTKKILKYLATINSHRDALFSSASSENFEMKILQSNPILESFGNAQTVRNNNSSRFGKFIKVEFDDSGSITGAHIEWYLLEKSRILSQNSAERNYHIFYQLLSGLSMDDDLRSILQIESIRCDDYKILAGSNHNVSDVDDGQGFSELLRAFEIVGFNESEVQNIFKICSIILHLGNIEFKSSKSEQASFANSTSTVCKLLGVDVSNFETAVLKPKYRAGREWVTKAQNSIQAKSTLDSLARTLYESLFSHIVKLINRNLDCDNNVSTNYIGLLDIAGFEIFENNSFEQLCINYTNEKLQQFFNHYMFVLEQSEYLKENIEWDYVDYAVNLQLNINLLEQREKPAGILPLLDEEAILPKSSDESFFSKMISSWEKNSSQFKRSKKPMSFILKHYAGEVEYNVDGWLSKNKDSINEFLLSSLSNSSNSLVSTFFTENNANTNKNSFRTTSSRHREQQISLLKQLSSTEPHFVRCIIPNTMKKSLKFDRALILEQLRYNGVLEGIRIAREGYPNRLEFHDFYRKYRLMLNHPNTEHDSKIGQANVKNQCQCIIDLLSLGAHDYKIGKSKLFFKAGILAIIEAKKDEMLNTIIGQFGSLTRGNSMRKRTQERMKYISATKRMTTAFRNYSKSLQDPWFELLVRAQPQLENKYDAKTNSLAQQNKTLKQQLSELNKDRNNTHTKNMLMLEDLTQVKSTLKTEMEKLKANEIRLADVIKRRNLLEDELKNSNQLKAGLNEKLLALEEKCEFKEQEIEASKKLLNEKENMVKELTNRNKKYEDQIANLTEDSNSHNIKLEDITIARHRLEEECRSLKKELRDKEDQILSLKSQVNVTNNELESKLMTLEKNCTNAMTKLKGFVSENSILKKKLDELEFEHTSATQKLLRKTKEIEQLNIETRTLRARLDDIVTEKGEIIEQNSQLKAKLLAINADLREEKNKTAELLSENSKLEEDLNKHKKLIRDGSELESSNYQTNRSYRLPPSYEGADRDDHAAPSPFNKLELNKLGRSDYDHRNFNSSHLEKEYREAIEENKKIISKLRYVETRLASASFDNQKFRGQVKKLTEILKASNSNINLDAELKNLQVPEINVEKLLLEIEDLKSEKNSSQKIVTNNTENHLTPIHNSDDQSINTLNNTLSPVTPLKDRTNEYLNRSTPTRMLDVTKNGEGLKALKMENYELQQYLGDNNSKLAVLTHRLNQTEAKNILFKDQVDRLESELSTSHKQRGLLSERAEHYKQEYENCLRDLHHKETELAEYMRSFSQAQEDAAAMSALVEDLKKLNREKDRIILERDNLKTDLEIKLQENAIELKKVHDINEVLESDLIHLKERLANADDHTRYVEQISALNQELEQFTATESELKKQISTLKYQLSTSNNDYQIKISEMAKEIDHYSHLVDVLGSERDKTDASLNELKRKMESTEAELESLKREIVDINEDRSNLKNKCSSLRDEMGILRENYNSSVAENKKLVDNINYLEDTLKLHLEQTNRNDNFVNGLQKDLALLKTKLDEEKHNNIDLSEENLSLKKVNDQISQNLAKLQSTLSDTTEKDAWLLRIQELQSRVSEETNAKYEEIKKNTLLERNLEELKSLNTQQEKVIDIANKDRNTLESSLKVYNERLEEMEKYLTRQETELNSSKRDNFVHIDRIAQLERELRIWKNRAGDLAAGYQSTGY